MLNANDRDILREQMDAMISSVLAACQIMEEGSGGPYPQAVARNLNTSLHELHTTVKALLEPEGEG